MKKEDNNMKDDIEKALESLDKVKSIAIEPPIKTNNEPTIIEDYIVSIMELNPQSNFYTLMEQFLRTEKQRYSQDQYQSKKLRGINSQLNTTNSLLSSIDVSLHIHNLIKLWKLNLISDDDFSDEVQKLSKIKVDITDDSIWEY